MDIQYVAIGLAVSISILRVLIEYDWWNQKKRSRTNGIWFAIVFVICTFLHYVSDYSYFIIMIFVIVYWNIFELFSNYFHNQDILYVGETATFDKFLRRITKRYEILKFILHITSISIFLYLIL